MTDIVGRLCDPEYALTSSDRFHLHREAADEIKRLRGLLSRYLVAASIEADCDLAAETRAALEGKMTAFYDNVREITRLNAHITKQDAEIERLRAALRRITNAWEFRNGELRHTIHQIARAALEGK